MRNFEPMNYLGVLFVNYSFKVFINGQTIFLKNKDTELSKEYWKLKERNINPVITWEIKTKCGPFNPTSGKCSLCLNEKLLILEASDDRNLLNKRNKLVSKCRHQNKFKLSSLKTDIT